MFTQNIFQAQTCPLPNYFGSQKVFAVHIKKIEGFMICSTLNCGYACTFFLLLSEIFWCIQFLQMYEVEGLQYNINTYGYLYNIMKLFVIGKEEGNEGEEA